MCADNHSLAGSSPDDATYTKTENTLTRLGNDRDAVVAQLQGMLYGAEFGGASVGSSGALLSAANGLLGQASALAG